MVNEKEASRWFEKAAEVNAQCYKTIGDIYYTGNVIFWDGSEFSRVLGAQNLIFNINTTRIPKNYEKSLAWYLKAVEDTRSGETPATEIARIYYNGEYGVEKDYMKALLWTEPFLGGKNPEETIDIIVNIYKHGGYGVKKDAKKALQYCFLIKNCPLYLKAGEIYQFGIYPPNFKKAFEYYQKALKLGKSYNGAVIRRLGYLYLKGLGVKKDIKHDVSILSDYLSHQGPSLEAFCYYQGYFAHYGIETAIDYDRAQNYYRGCKKGDKFFGKAMNQLGLIQQIKSKTAEDFATANIFFKIAAEDDCHDAFNSLGDVYKYGLGVEVDYEEAFKWYKKAAKESVDNNGHFNLAVMYSEGKGTRVDHKLALQWFQIAQTYGNEQVSPLLISQIKALVVRIDILESQVESTRISTQVPQEKELPKMFVVVDKRQH